jgi:hypothetical protein
VTRDAIPQLHPPDAPRTETRGYADASRRFGMPHAPPAMADRLDVGRVADWTPAQLLAAAHEGAADPNALGDADVARICMAFVVVVDQHAREMLDVHGRLACALSDHAMVSAENVVLRHRLAGTMPAAEVVAKARTDTLNDRIHSHISLDDADTVVVEIPIPERTRP